MRKNVTRTTMLPTNAGYMSSFFVCAASSSSHFSCSVRLLSTSESLPVCSPERTRLTNTLLNTSGYSASDCDRLLPPSIDSISPETTSRKRRFSTLSRRSTSPSTIGTPALESCSRWKQKLIRSWRLIFVPPTRRLFCADGAPETRSRPMRDRRCSRSNRFTASTRPSTDLPCASIAL